MNNLVQADIAVIGGGIVGTAIARELAKYQKKVVLLEQHPDVAMETTKANSAILHAGYASRPGTLKAKLNVRGNELYRQLEKELDLDIEWIGSLVVAREQSEIKKLEQLANWGEVNGVPGLKILSASETVAQEPNLTSDIAGSLWAPSAGIIWPFGATIAFAENAVRNGVEIFTECRVTGVAIEDGCIRGVQTEKGFVSAKYVINASGVWADKISSMAGDETFHITPRKGEYILFDRTVASLVNHVVFPLPTEVSKGILIAPTVHGNVFIGPNANEAADKEDADTSIIGMEEIIAGARKLIPDIPLHKAITQFAGLRAVPDQEDFIIKKSANVQGLIHAAGMESPGLTAAPAVAEYVCEILKSMDSNMNLKQSFVAENPPLVRFNKLSNEEKQQLITTNSLYGRIICRCETVSEGEIIDAIHRPCGARTVDGVKRRVGAGLGRCQGGFCGPRVVTILARELNIPVSEVEKDYTGSIMFYEKLPGYCGVSE